MTEPDPIVLDYRHPQTNESRRRSLGEELFKAAALANLFIAYGLYGDPDKPLDFFFYSGLLTWLVVAVTYFRRRQDLSTFDVSLGWRRALKGMAVVCLLLPNLLVLFPYHCVHGYRWANRWFAVAWSENGGPCGDGPHAWGTHPKQISRYWYVYIPRS